MSKSGESSSGLSAAELIKRFKEGKPTSREEREQLRQSEGKSRMWWENDSSDISKRAQSDVPPFRSVTPTSVRPSAKYANADTGTEAIEEPRRPYLKPPMVQPSRRELSDSRELFRSSENLGNSMDVDYLIEKEIRNLEKDIQKKERETMKRLNMGSFTPQRGLNRSMENGLNVGTSYSSPHVRYRPTLRDQGGLLGSSNPRQEDLLSKSGELFRQSVDTLGSTGMLGLLRADLKLDGKKDPKAEEENKEKESNASKPGDVQIDLDALMKSLREFMPEEKPRYLPDGVEETIPQITNRLHCEMMEFMSLYNGAMIREKEREEEQKKRDEEMKEEGRRLERERKLLEIDIPPFQHPLDYVQDNGQNSAKVLGNYLRQNSEDNRSLNGDESKVPPFADDHRYYREQPGDARFASRLLDMELQQVDATYGRMRQVRHQLASQINHLNHVARDPSRFAQEQQYSSRRHGRTHYNEDVDDGHGYRPTQGYEDDYANEDPDFDPVRMQHDPKYRDQVLQHRSRRRQAWNPYPEMLPENIFNTAKAIESMLNSTMDTLNRRLPEKRQPIPSTSTASTISPRPATPMPSAAQREAALTPVPHPTSSTPVPTTPASVSSQGSSSTQQSVTTATNTALNAGRSPVPVTGVPAIPTTSTAPNSTVVKPIATTPTVTTSVSATKPATATSAPVNASSQSKPIPELKSDTSGHIERLVDSLVATAKEKVASGGTAPGAQKLDVSVTSLDLSRDSNLSAASSISLSSSHERLIPAVNTAAATSVSASAPAPNSGLRASVSTPVPSATAAPASSASSASSSAAAAAARPRATTPLPVNGTAPAPITSTTASGVWTAAQMDMMHRDLEYVDNVLNQVDRAPGRFDKYTQPNIQYRPPPITPAPAAPSTANKSVSFASNLASISHDPHDPANAPGSASRGILITPRGTTPSMTAPAPVDPLQNHNPGITPDLVDPMRELRQRAPHRVYEHVLYRPGSHLHPQNPSQSSYYGTDPVFSGASAPVLPLNIPPPSINPRHEIIGVTNDAYSFTTNAPLPSTTLLHPRPVEGSALRMLHYGGSMTASNANQSYSQPSALPHSSSFLSSAPQMVSSSSGYYADPAVSMVPHASFAPSPINASSSSQDREKFLHQMKHLRQQLGGNAGSSSAGTFRSPSSVANMY